METTDETTRIEGNILSNTTNSPLIAGVYTFASSATIANTITFEGAGSRSELLPPTDFSESGLWLLLVLV
jgi:hypothetical protein